jgi:hypothetical protein
MPLGKNIPLIDARRYDAIFKELRARIPHYTPEWTDFNDSDPGMTLVQLFSWMSDMLLYRMGKVPELNYIKFLELIGIELRPAEPARAEITFPLKHDFDKPYLIIPERTQVSAESNDGGPPIIFETETSLTALTANLDRVQVFDRGSCSDFSSAHNEPGQSYDPFGSSATADNALLFGLDCGKDKNGKDRDFPDTTMINLMLWAESSATGPAPCDCGLPETRVYLSSNIAWEYWIGNEWKPLVLLKDETVGFSRSGHILLKSPGKGEMQKCQIGQVSEERFWIRARVVRSGNEQPKKVYAIRTNTVSAIQAQTVSNEVVGDSDGSPNQAYKLANAPVVSGSLQLHVFEEDGEYHDWQEVPDFFGSGKEDRHYVLNRTSGELRFGDGINGMIPPGLPESNGESIVAAEYRFGGGARGNVKAGTITSLLSSLSGVDEGKVANLRDADSGRDEETLDEAKERAPQSLKSRCRAVTESDFEEFAKAAANIKRAKALPLFHPSFPGVKVPGVVTVIVVPDVDTPNPQPGEGTLRTVCDYLNKRRLLTTELYIVGPTYNKVSIEADVIAEDRADAAEVQKNVESTLLEYFHPLKGGEDGMGWPFGGDIFFSKVYQQIFSVSGVSRVERVTVTLDGVAAEDCKDVSICDGALVYSTDHTVNVTYAFES